jgi:hypothetical protein
VAGSWNHAIPAGFGRRVQDKIIMPSRALLKRHQEPEAGIEKDWLPASKAEMQNGGACAPPFCQKP